MRIRIVSDGMPYGTRIFDVDTGEDLTEVLPCTSITWNLRVGEYAGVELTMLLNKMDVVAEVKRIRLVNPGMIIDGLDELCGEEKSSE